MTPELTELLKNVAMEETGVYDDSPEMQTRFERYVKQGYNWLIQFNDGDLIVFDEYSLEFELIVQRARYTYNGALDIFEMNHKELLNKLILDIALRKKATNNAPTEP